MTAEYLTLTELVILWQRDVEHVLRLLEHHRITLYGETSDPQHVNPTVSPEMIMVAKADCRRLEWKLFKNHLRVWSAHRGSPLEKLPPMRGEKIPERLQIDKGCTWIWDYYRPDFLAEAPIHFALLRQPQAKVRWIIPAPPTTPEVLEGPSLGAIREQSCDSTAGQSEQLKAARERRREREARDKAATIALAKSLLAIDATLPIYSKHKPCIATNEGIPKKPDGTKYSPETIRRWVCEDHPNRELNKERHDYRKIKEPSP